MIFRLLDRYITRQFLASFFTLVLGLPLLFIITDVTENLDKYLGRGLPLSDVVWSYVYVLPQYVLWAMPIAALVGTVFTIGNMTRHQEISAAKAGGISFYRILAPLLMLGMLLSGAALGLNELVPVTNETRSQLLGERLNRTGMLRTNFVFLTEDGRVLSVRRLDPDRGEMTGVVIEQEGNETRPAMHQTAERAAWKEGEGWTLERGYIRLISGEGTEAAFQYAGTQLSTLQETPEELLADPKDPDQMRYHEITRFIRAIERSGGDTGGLRTEQAQKISLPMAILVIVLFGAPLATSNQRGGAAFGIGISLAVTMIYLLLFRVGKAVGTSGAVDPILAAWMPNAIFLVAGLILLSRVRT
jgi:lipopolysaccharide export system permease protein